MWLVFYVGYPGDKRVNSLAQRKDGGGGDFHKRLMFVVLSTLGVGKEQGWVRGRGGTARTNCLGTTNRTAHVYKVEQLYDIIGQISFFWAQQADQEGLKDGFAGYLPSTGLQFFSDFAGQT